MPTHSSQLVNKFMVTSVVTCMQLEFEKAKLCSLRRRNKSEREFIYCSRNSITRSKDNCRDSCHNRKYNSQELLERSCYNRTTQIKETESK